MLFYRWNGTSTSHGLGISQEKAEAPRGRVVIVSDETTCFRVSFLMPLPPSEFKCNCSPRTMTDLSPRTLMSETFTVMGNQMTARNILGLWGPCACLGRR